MYVHHMCVNECASVRVCMCKCMPECLQVSVGVYEGVRV